MLRYLLDLASMQNSVGGENTTLSDLNNTDDLIETFIKNYPVDIWKRDGFFDDNYLHLINRHWLQFLPPSPLRHYLLAVLYTLIMSVGVIGNVLVIIMLLRCRSLRTPANILVMNLAISDFFMIAKMPIFIYNSIKLGPALGEIGCQVYGFLGGLTGTVSIATLAAIAMDRYFVIIYPLDPLKRTTKLRAGVCVVLSWLYGALFASLPLFGFNRYVPEGYLTSCSFDYLSNDYSSRIFIIVFFIAAWVVPFIIISFSYANICIMVMNARQGGARSASGSREQQRKTELKLALVVVAIIGLWFCAWTPYAIVALLGFSGQKQLLLPLTSMVPALFCKIASCLDPFVYAVSHPRFRRELIRCFSKNQNVKGDQIMKSRAITAIAGVEMKKVVQKELSYSCTEDEDDNMMMVEFKMNNGCSATTKSEPRWVRTNSSRSNNVWLTNSSKLKMSSKQNMKTPVSF